MFLSPCTSVVSVRWQYCVKACRLAALHNSTFTNIRLVPWNRGRREYLHHGNWQKLQTTSVFSPLIPPPQEPVRQVEGQGPISKLSDPATKLCHPISPAQPEAAQRHTGRGRRTQSLGALPPTCQREGQHELRLGGMRHFPLVFTSSLPLQHLSLSFLPNKVTEFWSQRAVLSKNQ